MKVPIRHLAKSTRWHRRIHKYVALSLFILMFIIGATGLLLAWKKEFFFLPPTQKDIFTGPSLSLEKIQEVASHYILKNTNLDTEVDRIDVRLNSGVAKVRFVNHYSEVQVGIHSGKILSVEHRTSDLIEQIHDGSILDFLAGTDDDWFKKFYVTLTCIGLITLSITGFYLWYNPALMKRRKRRILRRSKVKNIIKWRNLLFRNQLLVRIPIIGPSPLLHLTQVCYI